MQRGLLEVPVQHLTDAPTTVALRCTAEAIGLREFTGEIAVNATARRIDRRILIACEIHGTLQGVCDRCAEPFAREYTVAYEQWYVIDGHPDGNEMEEDARAIAPEQPVAVIDEDVRETVLVALPMKRLCRDDCQGLCPQCGRNRNTEPCDCDDAHEHPLQAGLKRIRN